MVQFLLASHYSKSSSIVSSLLLKTLFRKMSRAVQVNQFGGSDVLTVANDVQPVEPQANEVQIELKSSGVNPVDTYIRSGTYPAKPQLPYIPGKDGAGIVKKVGSQVAKFKAGDTVFVCSNGRFGTLAEFATIPERNVFHLDKKLSFDEGAALGVPYFTAYRALYILSKGGPGKRVLIHGASGGVGQAAVQLAVAGKMDVVGTAGTQEGLDVVTQNGAKAYCHREDGYVQKMSSDGGPFDIIVEMLSNVNLGTDLTILRPKGTVVVVGNRGDVTISPRLMMGPETSIVGCALMTSSDDEWAQIGSAIQDAVKNGTIKPRISKRYSLEEAGKAHDDIMSGQSTLGKLVVQIAK